jgi:hypothetical protein
MSCVACGGSGVRCCEFGSDPLCLGCGDSLDAEHVERGFEVCTRCTTEDELFDEGAERAKGTW